MFLGHMNKRGHPETLVAARPGNRNAVRHGAHSPRLIQKRAAVVNASRLILARFEHQNALPEIRAKGS